MALLISRDFLFSTEKLVELRADAVVKREVREARGREKMLGSSFLNQSADTLPNHRECPAATNLS